MLAQTQLTVVVAPVLYLLVGIATAAPLELGDICGLEGVIPDQKSIPCSQKAQRQGSSLLVLSISPVFLLTTLHIWLSSA